LRLQFVSSKCVVGSEQPPRLAAVTWRPIVKTVTK
jgi:hypothetical protein